MTREQYAHALDHERAGTVEAGDEKARNSLAEQSGANPTGVAADSTADKRTDVGL